MDAKIALLQNVPLFAGLNRRELETIGGLCSEVDMPAGRTLMRQGDAGNEFFVIVDGRVRVERDGQTLATLGAGDFLGEIALIDHEPRTATAVCESDARLLVLDHREFHSLMATNQGLQVTILQALARRLRRYEADRPH